jgi:RNA-directed DNA polymerase
MRCIKKRILDKRFIKILWKMLKAGTIEDKKIISAQEGVAQGSLCKALHNDPYTK